MLLISVQPRTVTAATTVTVTVLVRHRISPAPASRARNPDTATVTVTVTAVAGTPPNPPIAGCPPWICRPLRATRRPPVRLPAQSSPPPTRCHTRTASTLPSAPSTLHRPAAAAPASAPAWVRSSSLAASASCSATAAPAASGQRWPPPSIVGARRRSARGPLPTSPASVALPSYRHRRLPARLPVLARALPPPPPRPSLPRAQAVARAL